MTSTTFQTMSLKYLFNKGTHQDKVDYLFTIHLFT